ncbi:hypothetical protein AWC17_26625 [Mycobacterium nebraskense]|nr:hypothetical protein ABW17_27765 [Mycobacterium nebraskense]ORW29661.1 hypothetical protein AWC17_26625 [Mycobacterium nebraskense]
MGLLLRGAFTFLGQSRSFPWGLEPNLVARYKFSAQARAGSLLSSTVTYCCAYFDENPDGQHLTQALEQAQ